MKKIGAHKKWTTLVMGFVLAFQLLTGTGFFCAFKYSHASGASGNDRTVFADTNAPFEEMSDDAWNGSVSQRESVPCSCRKHKKCPTIPRSALTSNASHRFSEIERHLQGAPCNYTAPYVKDHRFALRGGPPTIESAVGIAFPSATPLAITCVLLI